jgi:hypothetical protein
MQKKSKSTPGLHDLIGLIDDISLCAVANRLIRTIPVCFNAIVARRQDLHPWKKRFRKRSALDGYPQYRV